MGSIRRVIKLRSKKRFIKKSNKFNKILRGNPQLKGVCLKILRQNPRKPDSGTRSVCILRLSNQKRVRAFIPGIGHGLQEHGVVLVHGGKRKNLPGVNLKVIRGKYDMNPVSGRRTSRSKYGGSRSNVN